MKRSISPAQSMFLDATRGISALAVLVGHGLTMLPSKPALGNIYPIQSYGVVVFFIISGFLIGHNCMYRDNYTFTGYMIDRFSRVFTVFVPAFIFVVFLDLAVLQYYVHFAPSSLSFTTAVSNLLMFFETPIQKILPGFPIAPAWGSARQWWTVAVEWWLYVVFGIMFFMATASMAQRALMAVLALPAFLVVFVYFSYESLAQVWFLSAFVGCAFTVANVQGLKVVGRGFIAFFAFGYVLRFGYIDAGRFNAYELSFIMISTGLYFAVMLSLNTGDLSERSKAVFRPIWKWLADISYSLYLTHLTILGVYHGLVGIGTYFDLAVICLVCIAAAHVFTVLFDFRHRDVRAWLKRKYADFSGIADRFADATKMAFAAGAVVVSAGAFSLVMAANTGNHADELPANPDLKAFQRLDDFHVAGMIYFGALPSSDPDQGKTLLSALARGENPQPALEFLSVYEPELLPSGEQDNLLKKASEAGQADAMLKLFLEQGGELSEPENSQDRNRIEEIYQAAAEMNRSENVIDQERGARTLLRLAITDHTGATTLYADAVRGRRMARVPPISQIVPLLESAAATGDSLAAFVLGDIFRVGEGDIKQSAERAGAYYAYALGRGYHPARERLEKLGIVPANVVAAQSDSSEYQLFKVRSDIELGTLKMLNSMPWTARAKSDEAGRIEGLSMLSELANRGFEDASRLLAIHDAPDWLPSGSDPDALVSSAAMDGWPDAMLKVSQRLSDTETRRFSSGEIYRKAVDFNTQADLGRRERGAIVLRSLASDGHIDSMVMFGDAVRGRRMVNPPPMSVAVTYWTRAALKGDALAAFLLGETYTAGADDVQSDEAEALRYYELAASRGYPPAKEKLAALKGE